MQNRQKDSCIYTCNVNCIPFIIRTMNVNDDLSFSKFSYKLTSEESSVSVGDYVAYLIA